MRLSILFLLAALGCSLDTVHADDAKSKPSTKIVVELSNNDLIGQWQVAQIKQKEQEIKLQSTAKKAHLTIKLSDDDKLSYHGFLGCNNLTATGILKNSQITFTQSSASFKFCSGAMDAEMAFNQLITQPMQAELKENTLVFKNTLGQIELHKASSMDQPNHTQNNNVKSSDTSSPPQLSEKTLEGHYKAQQMDQKNLTKLSSPITIQFQRGHLSGHDGCNGYNGRYKLTGNTLVLVGEPSTTLMMCPELENYPLLSFLGSRPKIQYEHGKLTLSNKTKTWIFLKR